MLLLNVSQKWKHLDSFKIELEINQKIKIENDFLKVWNKLSKKESILPDWDSLE